MKKLVCALVVAVGLIALAGPTKSADAQVLYCSHCCDIDPWNNPRVRCTLVSPWPCGSNCACVNIIGSGFACD